MDLFDGFPYLVTRIVPALYHLTVLPAPFDVGALVEIAKAQIAANNLETCIAFEKNRAVFFGIDGSASVAHEPPRGGRVIVGRLAPPMAFPATANLRARRQRLAKFVEKDSLRGGYILGDLTKGGRAATPRELRVLAGLNDDGSPRGLEQCERCTDLRGVCLDPNDQFRGQVMTVHCCCANHNRCARCGGHLHERRLNANYYERSDGLIWHVPGFCGLSHNCGEFATPSDLTHRHTTP